MKLNNYWLLKFRYQAYFGGFAITACLLSAFPTWLFATWFADLLNISMHEPVKEHKNGGFWFAGFMVVMSTNFLLCCLFLATLVGKINKWKKEQTLDYFLRGNYPKHWFKDFENVT